MSIDGERSGVLTRDVKGGGGVNHELAHEHLEAAAQPRVGDGTGGHVFGEPSREREQAYEAFPLRGAPLLRGRAPGPSLPREPHGNSVGSGVWEPGQAGRRKRTVLRPGHEGLRGHARALPGRREEEGQQARRAQVQAEEEAGAEGPAGR